SPGARSDGPADRQQRMRIRMPRLEIDDDLVRRLAGLLEETGLSEIEFAEGDRRIRVTRGAPVPAAPAPAAPAPLPAGGAAVPAGPAAAGPPAGAVTSPMVGTIYLAPDPGSPPFVRTGDQIAEGQT